MGSWGRVRRWVFWMGLVCVAVGGHGLGPDPPVMAVVVAVAMAVVVTIAVTMAVTKTARVLLKLFRQPYGDVPQ